MDQPRKARTERDSMGEFMVPVDAYYGAQTMRAVANFPISDLRFSRSFIYALGRSSSPLLRSTPSWDC